MKMEKKKFRIGELAEKVGVERFVIRFWEKEFELSSARSNGGQRFYTEQDLATFMQIKTLLYNEGFTISGAKKKLSETPSAPEATPQVHVKKADERWAKKTDWDQEELLNDIVNLKKRLSKLRDLL